MLSRLFVRGYPFSFLSLPLSLSRSLALSLSLSLSVCLSVSLTLLRSCATMRYVSHRIAVTKHVLKAHRARRHTDIDSIDSILWKSNAA